MQLEQFHSVQPDRRQIEMWSLKLFFYFAITMSFPSYVFKVIPNKIN